MGLSILALSSACITVRIHAIQVLRVWARILRAVPGSRLLLKNKPFACASARAHTSAALAAHGVDSSRVRGTSVLSLLSEWRPKLAVCPRLRPSGPSLVTMVSGDGGRCPDTEHLKLLLVAAVTGRNRQHLSSTMNLSCN